MPFISSYDSFWYKIHFHRLSFFDCFIFRLCVVLYIMCYIKSESHVHSILLDSVFNPHSKYVFQLGSLIHLHLNQWYRKIYHCHFVTSFLYFLWLFVPYFSLSCFPLFFFDFFVVTCFDILCVYFIFSFDYQFSYIKFLTNL